MRKVVFLPCHPNMWEGFETIWDMETSDPSNEVVAIPIPTYSRGHDNSLYDTQYITEGYPDNVRILGVNDYSLAAEHPDTIYIQNIQDAYNPGFTVHPHFHTTNLRSFTNDLVYIPYDCMAHVDPDNTTIDKYYSILLTPPGIQNVDRIIVQSENMKTMYLKYLAGKNESLYKKWDENISFTDYPRVRILEKYTKETVPHPSSWDRYLFSTDGSRKKVTLLTTSVVDIIKNNRASFRKARKVFDEFLDEKKMEVLIWRPHKHLPEIIMKHRPELFDDFRQLLEFFLTNDVGIFDETPTPTPAIILSDSFIDEECGLKELYLRTGKPIKQCT